MRRINKSRIGKLLRSLAIPLSLFGVCSSANATSVANELLPGYYSGCPFADPLSQCCLKFTITVTNAPENVRIDLLGPAGSWTSCFDWDCYTRTYSSAVQGTGVDSNKVMENFAANGTYVRYLCPVQGKEACAKAWTAFQWYADGTNPYQQGEAGLSWNCGGEPHMCDSLCDMVKVYNNGTNIVICVTRNRSTPTNRISVYFNPSLNGPCNGIQGTGTIGTPPQPALHWPSTWNVPSPSFKDSLIFVRNGGGPVLNPCQTQCFSIPICGDNPGEPPSQFRTVIVKTDSTSDCNQSFGYAFKMTSDGAYRLDGSRAPETGESVPNYPNPLSAANDFKTVIPFTCQNEGEAEITVVNEAGEKILTESMEVDRGKHFFYFTGEMLPAGRYFYTIESPKGWVIVRRSMLIVK